MSDVPGRLLRETLQAGMLGESRGCVDAETVARWADDTLTREERAAVEAHAASCARCQSMLAAMARTAPPAVARSWFRSPIVAWVAPLTAVAAALLIYVEVAPRSRSSAPAASAMTRATAARDAAPDLRAPVPVAQADQAGRSASLSGERKPAETDKRAVAETRAKDAREARGAAVAKALPSQTQAPATAETKPPVAPPATVAEASAPAPPPAAAAAKPVPPAAQSASAPRATAPPAAPPASVVAGGVASRDESPERANAARTLALSSRRPPSAILIPSSAFNTRWRVLPTGVVERTTDSGSTWEDTQSTGARVAPTAGASPSPSVCWLVGPQGLVLLSTDGRSWKRITFPETIDLTSVAAVNDKAAAVTTANGRTFKTTDGGASWTR